MIIGVDHLALSTDNIDRSVSDLARLGYRPSFVERHLPNALEKRSLVRSFTDHHSIALCRHPGGVSVELTEHGHAGECRGGYQALLKSCEPATSTNGDSEPDVLAQAWVAAGLANHPHKVNVPELGCPCWLDANGAEENPSGVRAVGLIVANIEQSLRFWRDGLGFREKNSGGLPGGERWEHLHFLSPMPAWSLHVVLVEGPARAELPMLDDHGMMCVALLSTDINGDLAWAAGHAREATEKPFPLSVAGKRLQIALLRGPAGEIVELIQP